MREIHFTIPLAPVTKKNSQRIADCERYKKILPSKAYVQYEKDAGHFLPHRGERIDQPCEVACLFYMPTRRRVDLTNLEEAIDDVLVKYGVLADDNSDIIVSHDGSRVLLDRGRPRTEVTIRFLDELTGGPHELETRSHRQTETLRGPEDRHREYPAGHRATSDSHFHHP